MKKPLKFLAFGIMALAIAFNSCSKDGDLGPIGPEGPQGEQGIQGPVGPDGSAGPVGPAGPQGETGPTGPAGTNGTNGTDGENGNTNVNTYIYDFSRRSAAYFNVDVPPITAEVMQNDLILVYLKTRYGRYLSIPSPLYADADSEAAAVTVEIVVGQLLIGFYEVGTTTLKNVTTGESDNLKVVIVESNSTSGKSDAASLRSELKSKGVDTNDYFAVMDYFGLAY